jgi:hypothetical protein
MTEKKRAAAKRIKGKSSGGLTSLERVDEEAEFLLEKSKSDGQEFICRVRQR